MKIDFSWGQVDSLTMALEALKKYVQTDIDMFQYIYGYFYDISLDDKKKELNELLYISDGFLKILGRLHE